MKICVTRSNTSAYSETFIVRQIACLKSYFGEEQVRLIYENWLPQRDASGKLLNPLPLLLMHKIVKNIFHKEDTIISLFGLIKYFRQHQFDVVLANYGVTGAKIWKACAKANIPLIVHFHGFDAFHKQTLKRYGNAYRKMFQYASYLIAVSDDMCKQLIALGAEEQKVVRIPYGINTSYFVPDNPFHLQRKSASPPVFLAVGRFTAKKAPHLTIQAFRKVLEEIPESKLIMVGDGELLEMCRELVENLGLSGKIEFKGVLPSSDIAQLMREARAFVQHSVTAPDGDKEGMPNTILEACASALPVVSTYHAGIPEAVLHGKTGFLVEEGDVEGMAQYMIKLAKDPALAAELGYAARKHIEQHYTQERQLSRIVELIYSCT